jgi:general secretion pathway protein G
VSPSRQRGVSFVEMMATVAILMILASAIIPMARTANKRRKELELHSALRKIRAALDLYIAYCNPALPSPDSHQPPLKVEPCLDHQGPKDLKDLWEGVSFTQYVGKDKLKILRKEIRDPMTGEEFGKRCYQDDPDSTSWCGKDVWNVYSKSTQTALDGTKYSDW